MYLKQLNRSGGENLIVLLSIITLISGIGWRYVRRRGVNVLNNTAGYRGVISPLFARARHRLRCRVRKKTPYERIESIKFSQTILRREMRDGFYMDRRYKAAGINERRVVMPIAL